MTGANPTCSDPEFLGKASSSKRLNHIGLIKKKSYTMREKGHLLLYPGFPWRNLQLTELCLLGLGGGWGESQVLLGKDEDSDLGDSNTSPPSFRKERKKPLHASEVAN